MAMGRGLMIVVGVLMSASLWGCGYNDLQGLDEDTKAAWSEVVNQYQRRADLIPNPVAFEQFQKVQAGLSSALGRLIAVAENYPNLKADQNFRDLQSQLEGTENRIAVARKRYIDRVAEFNKMVRYFPTNLTAKFMLHMEEKPNFTVADEKAVAKPPEVKFN